MKVTHPTPSIGRNPLRVAVLWLLPVTVGGLGLVRGYHAPGELAFETMSITLGAIGFFHYMYYSRIFLTNNCIRSRDILGANWVVDFANIISLTTEIAHGGKATNFRLVIHTRQGRVRINLNNYSERDILTILDSIRTRCRGVSISDEAGILPVSEPPTLDVSGSS